MPRPGDWLVKSCVREAKKVGGRTRYKIDTGGAAARESNDPACRCVMYMRSRSKYNNHTHTCIYIFIYIHTQSKSKGTQIKLNNKSYYFAFCMNKVNSNYVKISLYTRTNSFQCPNSSDSGGDLGEY